MTIRTFEDWIAQAKVVAPLLPEYMYYISPGQVDPGMVRREMDRLLEAEDWELLATRFQEVWSWLPDRADIRRHPFGLLCDLCSEWKVWEAHDPVTDALLNGDGKPWKGGLL